MGVNSRKDDLFLEQTKFVLQKRNVTTGEWQTKGLQIEGRTLARRELNKQKKEDPEGEWRAVPKGFADSYKQGWKDHAEYVSDSGPRRNSA